MFDLIETANPIQIVRASLEWAICCWQIPIDR